MSRPEEIRQFNANSDKLWLFFSRGLFICLGSIILATFLDYGLTYDEEFGSWYGRLVLKWYASFFKDQSALGYYDLHLYGGFFEATTQAIVSLTRKISPLGFYETRHLINALFGLLGIYYTCNLGTHIAGPRAGFFSGQHHAAGAGVAAGRAPDRFQQRWLRSHDRHAGRTRR